MITWTTCLTQWNYESCRVRPLKMDGSGWRVLTKSGPLDSAQSFSRVQLCDPMDCNKSGFPVDHQPQTLLKFMSIKSVMLSDRLNLCHPLLLPTSISPSIMVFSSESVLRIMWPSSGVSALTSVLPMNIQDWFPLGWTGWISLQSKWLSRVFSNTTVQKHQFFSVSFLYSPTLTSIHDC